MYWMRWVVEFIFLFFFLCLLFYICSKLCVQVRQFCPFWKSALCLCVNACVFFFVFLFFLFFISRLSCRFECVWVFMWFECVCVVCEYVYVVCFCYSGSLVDTVVVVGFGCFICVFVCFWLCCIYTYKCLICIYFCTLCSMYVCLWVIFPLLLSNMLFFCPNFVVNYCCGLFNTWSMLQKYIYKY